jgi:hypothetical protein
MGLAEHTPVYFARIGNSPTNYRESDIAMSRKNGGVVKYFLWRYLPVQYRPSIKATVSSPLDHEYNDTARPEPRRLPLDRGRAERIPTPKPSVRQGREARFSKLFPRRLEQIEPHVARH